MWHILEYYSAFKREEILSHATTCMNSEDMVLNEIKQSQKDRKTHPVGFRFCVVSQSNSQRQ